MRLKSKPYVSPDVHPEGFGGFKRLGGSAKMPK